MYRRHYLFYTLTDMYFLGALIYLLDLFCNSMNPAVRIRTAELFAKMMGDKLIGPRVKIVLSKFLPSIFMDAMRDNPDASVHMFEGMHFFFCLLIFDVTVFCFCQSMDQGSFG